MLLSDLKNRQHLVLLEKDRTKYVLYPSKREEVEDLEYVISRKIDIKDHIYEFLIQEGIEVNMVGHKSELKTSYVSDIIPEIKCHKIKHGTLDDREDRTKFINEYKCYQEHRNGAGTDVIKHEDKLSSFICALDRIQSDYFIVLKETTLVSFEMYLVDMGDTRILATPIPKGEGIMEQIENQREHLLSELDPETIEQFKKLENGDSQDNNTETHSAN